MIRALILPSGAADVICMKHERSLRICHGTAPFCPIPLDGVAPTMIVKPDILRE